LFEVCDKESRRDANNSPNERKLRREKLASGAEDIKSEYAPKRLEASKNSAKIATS